jgi:kinesin family member C1
LLTPESALKQALSVANDRITGLTNDVSDLALMKRQLNESEQKRLYIHNQYLELKGNVRVFARIRPILEITGEKSLEPAQITIPECLEQNEIILRGSERTTSLGKDATEMYSHSFDRVFGPDSQNTEVFKEVGELVQSALDGYNVSIFAYGQTNSGKTHTMASPDGIIPQAFRLIYRTIEARKLQEWSYTVTGNFLEIYNDDVYDLLSTAGKAKVDVRQDTETSETVFKGLTNAVVTSPEGMEAFLNRAMLKRSVAATQANQRSSRSHAIFMLKLVGSNSETGVETVSTLNLVDLAGSETLSLGEKEAARVQEAAHINQSLRALGRVIEALDRQGAGDADVHVPYRDSKLTYVLQFALAARHSKTLMFVMASPLKKDLTQTKKTLEFANQIHTVKVGAARIQFPRAKKQSLARQSISAMSAVKKRKRTGEQASSLLRPSPKEEGES